MHCFVANVLQKIILFFTKYFITFYVVVVFRDCLDGSQWSVSRSKFSPPTMWILGMKMRLSDL